jgi:hypothetical protein
MVIGLRGLTKATEYMYEPPPEAEIATGYANPQVIRLFLGLASREEASAVPAGSYRLTEGEINAYLKESVETQPGVGNVRVKIEDGSLLLYYSFVLLKQEPEKSETARKGKRGFFSGNIATSYQGRLRVVSADNGVRLEAVSQKMGSLAESAGGWTRRTEETDSARQPFPERYRGHAPGTDLERILRITWQGVSYGPEVASVELKPLEAWIRVVGVQTAPSP